MTTELHRNTDPRHEAKISRGLRWTVENTPMIDLRDVAERAETAPAEQPARAGPVR
jgi:hypothetical protein